MKIARCVLPNSGMAMYFFDCLKVTVLYKDWQIILIRGECTDCGKVFHATTGHGMFVAREYLKNKFRNHQRQDSREFCLSGTKTKRGEYGNELPAPTDIGTLVPSAEATMCHPNPGTGALHI